MLRLQLCTANMSNSDYTLPRFHQFVLYDFETFSDLIIVYTRSPKYCPAGGRGKDLARYENPSYTPCRYYISGSYLFVENNEVTENYVKKPPDRQSAFRINRRATSSASLSYEKATPARIWFPHKAYKMILNHPMRDSEVLVASNRSECQGKVSFAFSCLPQGGKLKRGSRVSSPGDLPLVLLATIPRLLVILSTTKAQLLVSKKLQIITLGFPCASSSIGGHHTFNHMRMAYQTPSAPPSGLQQARPIPGPKSFNKELELKGSNIYPPAKASIDLSRHSHADSTSILIISLSGQKKSFLL